MFVDSGTSTAAGAVTLFNNDDLQQKEVFLCGHCNIGYPVSCIPSKLSDVRIY